MVESYNLDLHFVAYIDILGFSQMVKAECESPTSNKYLEKILNVYYSISNYHSTENLGIIQFSDSIVLSMPFSKNKFSEFIKIISEFQYSLFSNGLLCKGGIAYRKHFSKEGFVFSNGLIEAYNVEREIAKYPRIVVSNELMTLIYKDDIILTDIFLIKENDGLIFVDFLENSDLNESRVQLEKIIKSNNSKKITVKEKLMWLSDYFDFKVDQSGNDILKMGKPKFSK